MIKFLIIFLCSFSIIISGQNWKLENNPYNMLYKNPYDRAGSRAEQEINRDINNVEKIINSSMKIYEHFEDDNNDLNIEEENSNYSSGSPGAPGEPVPIDDDLFLLFSALIIILFFNRKRILT